MKHNPPERSKSSRSIRIRGPISDLKLRCAIQRNEAARDELALSISLGLMHAPREDIVRECNSIAREHKVA